MKGLEGMDEKQSLELIEELQLNEPSTVAKVRVRGAVTVRSEIRVEPGNASERTGRHMVGQSREISREHLTLTAAMALRVGDVYLARFTVLPLPETYLVCTACRQLGPDTFEMEFRFFSPVDVTLLTDGA